MTRREATAVLTVALVALAAGCVLVFTGDAIHQAGGWVLLGVAAYFAGRVLRA